MSKSYYDDGLCKATTHELETDCKHYKKASYALCLYMCMTQECSNEKAKEEYETEKQAKRK